MPASLPYLITKYFAEHLPLQVGASPNTIQSYRDTMVQFLEHLDERRGKRTPATLADFDEAAVSDFVLHLETDRHVGAATRNQRLAALRSFARYVQRKELSVYDQCARILAIPAKRAAQRPMAYLSVAEVKLLLATPDPATKKGLRALAVLATLYETAARVQELADLTPGQLQLRDAARVELHGKGDKTRVIPIGPDVAAILAEYTVAHGIAEPGQPLFANSQGGKLTRVGIRYIVDKHVALAKAADPSMFQIKVTNHTFRHSKAVHLLEAGVNLVYIRDFLGHSSVTTTEIYARASPAIKERHILAHAATLAPGRDKYTPAEKQALIDWLKDQI
jgi:site-specific recombinase XerD